MALRAEAALALLPDPRNTTTTFTCRSCAGIRPMVALTAHRVGPGVDNFRPEVSPVAAEAQQAANVARIGYLGDNLAAGAHLRDTLLQGLRDLGYVEGRNVVIEYRFAEGKAERLPALAAELVALKVDVIVVGGGTPGALARLYRTHRAKDARRAWCP